MRSKHIFVRVLSVIPILLPLTNSAIAAMAPPDSVGRFECFRVMTSSVGPFGDEVKVPEGWLVHLRLWSALRSKSLIVAVTAESTVAPDRLTVEFGRSVLRPERPLPKRAPGSPRLRTSTTAWYVLRAWQPRTTVHDNRGRGELDASALVDSLPGAGAWITLYSEDGVRLTTARPEEER